MKPAKTHNPRWWNDSRIFVLGGLALLIGLSLAYSAVHSFSKPVDAGNLAFFTVDDGASVFADSADKLAPFDHNGKVAVKAIVYTFDGGKTRKVAYLERMTPAGIARIRERVSPSQVGKVPSAPVAPTPVPSDIEVKLPCTNSAWTNGADTVNASKIKTSNLPANSDNNFEIVVP